MQCVQKYAISGEQSAGQKKCIKVHRLGCRAIDVCMFMWTQMDKCRSSASKCLRTATLAHSIHAKFYHTRRKPPHRQQTHEPHTASQSSTVEHPIYKIIWVGTFSSPARPFRALHGTDAIQNSAICTISIRTRWMLWDCLIEMDKNCE